MRTAIVLFFLLPYSVCYAVISDSSSLIYLAPINITNNQVSQHLQYDPSGMLVHELLGHAWQVKNGFWTDNFDPTWNPSEGFYSDGWQKTTNSFIGLKYGERDATSIQNTFLGSVGLPLRPYYHSPAYSNLLDVRNGKTIVNPRNNETIIYRFPTQPSKFLKAPDTYESFPIWFLIALVLMPFKGFSQRKSLREQKKSLKEKMYDFILSDTTELGNSNQEFPYITMMKLFAWDSIGKKVLVVYYTANIYHDLNELHGINYKDFKTLGKKIMSGDTILPLNFYGEKYYNAIVTPDREVDSIWNKGTKKFFEHYFSCYLYFTGGDYQDISVFLKLFDLNVALASRNVMFFSYYQKRKLLGKPIRRKIYNEDGSLRCDCDDWDKGVWSNHKGRKKDIWSHPAK